VRALVLAAQERALAILRANRDVLDQAAAELLAHETLDAGQIPRPRPVSRG